MIDVIVDIANVKNKLKYKYEHHALEDIAKWFKQNNLYLYAHFCKGENNSHTYVCYNFDINQKDKALEFKLKWCM